MRSAWIGPEPTPCRWLRSGCSTTSAPKPHSSSSTRVWPTSSHDNNEPAISTDSAPVNNRYSNFWPARGLSNTAIGQELHLSIKTVEPLVRTIFIKLGLQPTVGSNRRVLAVLAYLRS